VFEIKERVVILIFIALSLIISGSFLKRTQVEEVRISSQTKKVNINTASFEELILLPGIGRILAERILEYRKRQGLFKNLEEIKKIKGIGEKKYLKLKNILSLN
jgi:competence protein ComEA